MIEYALTVIHGPEGADDVIWPGDRVPQSWPAQFRVELRAHGAVSTEKPPEAPVGTYPPRTLGMYGYAKRRNEGSLG